MDKPKHNLVQEYAEELARLVRPYCEYLLSYLDGRYKPLKSEYALEVRDGGIQLDFELKGVSRKLNLSFFISDNLGRMVKFREHLAQKYMEEIKNEFHEMLLQEGIKSLY